MARGNQRENAREAAQKKLGNVVSEMKTAFCLVLDGLMHFVEEQEHQDWLRDGCRQGERRCYHEGQAGRR
jgi:hypothetical protein